MTCKDCKHYIETVHADMSDYYICNRPRFMEQEVWQWVSSKIEKCEDFEPKEDSWDSVSK